MVDESSSAETAGVVSGAAENVTPLDQALWRRLSRATRAEEFGAAWLALQVRMIGGVTAALVVLERAEAPTFAPVAAWPRGGGESQQLGPVIERAIRERKGVVVRNDADGELEDRDELRFHLAYPVWVEDKVRGVAALQITPRLQDQLQAAMRQLQWGVAWLQNWMLRQTVDPEARARQRLGSALELTGVALQEERFQAAATAFVTDLATRLECDRVSLGFQEGRQVKVRALSHSAQFGKQMNLIRAIGGAMSESIDQQVTLVHPVPGKTGNVVRAHEQLARSHGDGAICTVPFVDGSGKAFGALTLERSAATPFDDETVELCEAVASLVGPILDEKRRNDRLLTTKIGDSLWTQVKRLVGPRHAVRKVVAAGIVLLVLFFVFAEGAYRVTAKTTLEGEIRRVVAAPFRGFVADAQVRSGDIVDEGDLICRLDDRDLRVEYSRVASEREQYVLEHRRAMAEGDVALMNVLTKRMDQSAAQLELLEDQIARTRIVAPFDGLVVSGDLSQSLGAPVEAGQVLFEVAPLDSYRVMLKVDEGDIEDIQAGQTGELILTALPETKHPFTVTKITPVSFSEEGSNLFLVEAELANVSERLRPGMEGFGKIRVDRRKLIWIWTHGLIDWARLWIWSWIP